MMLRTHFWTFDPDAAAEECARLHPGQKQETIRQADEICQNRFAFRGHWEMERTHTPVVFQNTIDWRCNPAGDPEWTYAFNRLSFLVVLGKAWRYTKDPRYPAAFARLAADWIDNMPLTAQNKSTGWRAIEAGLRCENLLRAVHLFAGSGVPDDALAQKLEDSLDQHAALLLEAHGPFQKLSNWGVLQDHGLLLLGLSLGKPAWCGTAAARLLTETSTQVLPDGTHWEQSPLYHCEVLHCCLNAVLAARRAGYPLPEGLLAKTHEMALALAYMIRPDGKLLCQGDSDEVDARDLIALAAFLFGDETLWGYAGPQLQEENLWDFGDMAKGTEGLPTGRRKGSVALEHSGNYMLWDALDDDAGVLHFHCGTLGSGHGHADLLHFDLVCRGEGILVDSGRYTYQDTPLRHYLKSPSAHNTIRVDGQDFSIPNGAWGYSKIAEPQKGPHRFTPAADYVSGSHLGYLPQGVLPTRHILRLGKDLWLVWDSLKSTDDAPHSYEHIFHFGPQGKVALEGATARYAGKNVNASLLFLGEETSLGFSRGPLSREYNRMEEGDIITARHTTRGFGWLATLIATGAQAPSLSAHMLPATLQSAGTALPAHTAQGLRVQKGSEEWTVLLCHNEVIAEVDMLCAGGRAGYGKVIVFPPGEKTGQVLVW